VIVRAVIFDFDGVLADTETLHLSAFQDVFRARGWTLDRAAYFDRYLGFDDEDLVRAFMDDTKLAVSADDVASLVRIKTRRFAELMETGAILFPGAPSAIVRLGARYRLGIASGSTGAEIAAILHKAGLHARFRVIVGADDVARSKPAADPYVAAVTRLGVTPSAAVAIEDSRWGLTSARAAGLCTIGITTSYPARELSSADVVVDSLDEVTIELVEDVFKSFQTKETKDTKEPKDTKNSLGEPRRL
jgi:beta-phosphoglucomutase-like phosphatase (HAD superfamily)